MTPYQKQFLQKTQWLRPITRMATAFSIGTSSWLPSPIRNAPLKLIQRILRAYHKPTDSGCNKHGG
jgi:hypothetical protein